MSNGLVLVKNPTMAKVYSLNFQLYTDMNCLHYCGANSVEQFKDLIPFLDILIADPEIGDENIISLLDNMFEQEKINIPVIILSQKSVETKNNCFYFLKDFSVQNVIKNVGKILDITAQDMMAKVVPEYVPLHINYFKDLQDAPCSIFIRDIDEENEYIYHQIYEKGEQVKGEQIINLQREEKKNKLFIPKLERLKFVNLYTAQLLNKDSSKSGNSSKAFQSLLQMNRDNISSLIAGQEDMEEIMDLADVAISECMNEVESLGNKKIVDYLKALLNSTESYYLQHAQLSCYISFKILRELNWLSMSQKRTFAAAAFFKFILLNSDQEQLAKIRDDEQLDQLKREGIITQEEHILVKNIPQRTVAVLSRAGKQSFPENTLTIIREQNGNKAGVGFQRDDDKSLHGLSIAFILANAYADKILLDGLDDESIIISELESEFDGQRKFMKYIDLIKPKN